MRLLYRLCQLMFAAGLLSLVLATLNELFGLGIWEHNDYPSLAHNAQGQELPTTYGTFMWRFALVTVIAGVIGAVLHAYLVRRELRALEAAAVVATLEEMDEDERNAAWAALDDDDLER